MTTQYNPGTDPFTTGGVPIMSTYAATIKAAALARLRQAYQPGTALTFVSNGDTCQRTRGLDRNTHLIYETRDMETLELVCDPENDAAQMLQDIRMAIDLKPGFPGPIHGGDVIELWDGLTAEQIRADLSRTLYPDGFEGTRTVDPNHPWGWEPYWEPDGSKALGLAIIGGR